MFDWTDFLWLARELASNDDEAAQRTAISRAYYCVYHRSTETCRQRLGLLPARHRVWDQLEQFGLSHNQPVATLIGERGNDLKQLREIADYRNPYNRDDHQMESLAQLAVAMVLLAETILVDLDQLA